MNDFHKKILDEMRKKSKDGKTHFFNNRYNGNDNPTYLISVPQTREIAKEWSKQHKDISLEKFINLYESLLKGETTTEKSFGNKILRHFPNLRKNINPSLIYEWLDHLKGWCEVDSLCQSLFPVSDFLNKWNEWTKLIIKLSKDKNINKRRASLVLLTGPVSETEDKKIIELAFQMIDKLKHEKDILITKSVSWLLRSLIKKNKKLVEGYLKENETRLPKIAIREVKIKLLTGKK